MIVKACRRNITGEATTPVYKEKINQEVPNGISYQDPPLFLGFIPRPRNVGKIFLLSERMLFYPLSLNFCKSGSNHSTACYILN